MGRHLNRRHPVSGVLFAELRARARAMRAEHVPVQKIADALGVSQTCAHRWVIDAPEHAAATAQNGGVRIYPPGTRRFASKLWALGYRREQRIAMAHEMAAAGVPDTADNITPPAADARPRAPDPPA
ncbi:hypothetical protein MKK84_25980 [Methylobacterium sp. E-065]|uniref:hypothetical protein n=1 Tax=Methylobacterium sp. E-065 TaxID=2836583 RepID=UPI001FBB15A3|nr:hypothetical protein [Methylobacterium sp. E-065]MCJ2020829.1 hypothetical protein [Methylobacterium sp. E-065]